MKKTNKETETKKVTVKFDRKQLEEVLKVAQDFVSPKSTLPVLACVSLAVSIDTCTITATDLDRLWERTLDLAEAVSEDVAACVPAKTFYNEIKALDSTAAEIVFYEDHITICDRCEILTTPADAFPKLDRNFKKATDVVAAGFSSALGKVILAVSKENHRENLSGVCVDFPNGYVVGTDGYRMHLAPITKNEELPKIVIPRQTVQVMLKHNSDDAFSIKDGFLGADLGGGFMVARLLAVNFPDYLPIIPEIDDSYAKVKFFSKDFVKIHSEAAPVISADRCVVMGFGDIATIKTSGGMLGRYEWSMPCVKDETGDQSTIIIGLNSAYLIDVLTSYSSETVELAIHKTDRSRAIMINNMAILMPVRIDTDKVLPEPAFASQPASSVEGPIDNGDDMPPAFKEVAGSSETTAAEPEPVPAEPKKTKVKKLKKLKKAKARRKEKKARKAA